VASPLTINDLLRQLELRPDQVAVEVNLEIVDRQDFGSRSLSDGDRVEILGFIGGGDRKSDESRAGALHARNIE
jgi:thiamine biosynthesis protein ThiS